MTYQFSTSYPLAVCKFYIDDIKKCLPILEKCIEITDEWRVKKRKKLLTNQEILSGVSILRLDDRENPKIMNLVGPEREISTKNLKMQGE